MFDSRKLPHPQLGGEPKKIRDHSRRELIIRMLLACRQAKWYLRGLDADPHFRTGETLRATIKTLLRLRFPVDMTEDMAQQLIAVMKPVEFGFEFYQYVDAVEHQRIPPANVNNAQLDILFGFLKKGK